MNYKLVKLASGLRLITVPMPSLQSATITVWAGVGSRYEKKNISGISHFLEHMVFKGSKKRPSAKAISEAVDSFGGVFNASTGKEHTQYFIRSRVENLEIAFDVLSDMVLNPILKPSDIEREKGVILAEIDMYEDTPIRRIEEVFENLIFKGNSLERDIIGTKETVKKISKRDFSQYLGAHYNHQNLLLTVSGGVDEKKVVSLAEKYFEELGRGAKNKAKSFSEAQKKPRTHLSYKKTDQAHLILGYLGKPLGHKKRYVEAVLSSVLGGGMSSRMFTEVREKRALAYAVRTYADHYKDTGRFTTYAGTAPGKSEEAIKTILSEYKKMTSIGSANIKKKEFKKAKEYLKGHLALALESTTAVNGFFGLEYLLLEKLRTPKQIFAEVDKVTIDEVVSFAKSIFKPSKLNLAVIGPFKNKARFEKLLS